jgi:hypothetical protein
MPRLISAGLPPGYQVEERGDEPAAVLYLRLYCGLQCLSALVYSFYLGRQLLNELTHVTRDSVWALILAVGQAILLTILGANVLGLLCPRHPWMHTAGTIIIASSLLANSCCWLLGIPMLLAWLKPEVRRWFEASEPRG